MHPIRRKRQWSTAFTRLTFHRHASLPFVFTGARYPWRFAGGYFDSSTGLYKFGTRYYNPGFGRWSQQDPLRGQLNDPTSLNRYLYAGDDPVNFTDPSGKDQTLLEVFAKCALIAIVAIGVAAILFALATLIPIVGWALDLLLLGLAAIFAGSITLLFVECVEHNAWGL